ncbi:hypothetical protein NL676_033527 [Syzygium grande]|nr:hypothetical protein NL676_033527 [Syzygium grande]
MEGGRRSSPPPRCARFAVRRIPWDIGDPDRNRLLLRSSAEFMKEETLREAEETRRGSRGKPSPPYRYDVFLSFRGEDTRNGFTGHLHAALDRRGIDAFMDEEELRKGEEIAPAILGAIGESRISIVVFSEKYASSGWCLDELVRIVECRDTMGQIAWPVFYKVKPSDVRRQRGRYGQALIKHEERLKSKGGDSEKVKRWREALTKAANISGWHLKVAMDSHVDRMRTLLDIESNKVRMVGICGFGGIGKTTIAKATYNAFADKFECCGFLSSVRETYEKFADGGLLQLQEALISEVMWGDGLKLGNVHRGMSMIKSRLYRKKVLVVLDDVNNSIQLETLVGGHDWFGCGSRIIITTRDEHLLAAHGVDSIYKVQPLDPSDARMLFSSFAFPNVSPPPDYEELSYNVVDYTKGLPLAIKILGSSLKGRSLLEWKSELDKLKKFFNREIFSALRMSFDGLDDCIKDIFLDIACFFKGESISYVRKILESCDLYPDGGFAVLIDKSLITIEYGKLEMHDMIQEMGREIVRGESPKEPGKRSRLWSYEDVLHVLTEGTGTNKVEAIMLKLAAREEVKFSALAFRNTRRLRIFSVLNVYNSGHPIYFPAQLRWLEWPDYSPPSEPFNTGRDRRLVGLDLSKSSIRILAKEFKLFRNLRTVNFSHCTLLSEILDVSSLPNLESLDLQECTNLVEVHQSLGRLDKLVYLNFLNCCNLSCFPNSLKSRSLQDLILRGCSKLSRFPDILVQVKGLKELTLHETAIKELPSSVANLIELKELYLTDCVDLKKLPCSIYSLQHLEQIFTDGCSQLSKFPELACGSSDYINFSLPLALPSVIYLNVQRCSLSELSFLKNLHCMSSLTILDLSENKFVSLPISVGRFTRLQQLCCESLESCADLSHMLRYNPDESPRLRRIDFSGCHKLIQDQCSNSYDMLSIEGLLGETRVDIFHPGSKIPKWFIHQSMTGLAPEGTLRNCGVHLVYKQGQNDDRAAARRRPYQGTTLIVFRHLFRESSFELGKAEPFAKSLEEIASVAVLDAAAVWPSCSLRAAVDDVARPMQGLGEAGPVPFQRKTYQMVSDPVVSWGLSRDSFVVWDEHEFSKQVLPRYFKHSQLLQLHQAAQHLRFQRGKKHLLKNIKRRGKFSNHRKPWSSTVNLDYPKAGKGAELETLKMDQEAMKDEILKLREERENLRRVINQVAERIRYVKCRNRQMFLFLSKAAKIPNFVQHLMKKRRQKSEWITIFKARMLIT